MTLEPDERGMLDGALLVDAERPDSRKQIVELMLGGGRLAMIKKRGDHCTVHFLVKGSGEPQWCIDVWEEERTPCITDTMERARELAQEFARSAETDD